MLTSFFVFVPFAISEIDKVQNWTFIFQTHHPIFRFDVFVNVSSVVQNLNSVDHLKAQNENSLERHFSSREFHELFQVGAKQFHDKVIVFTLKSILKELGESDVSWNNERSTIGRAFDGFEDGDLSADLRGGDFIVFLGKIDDYHFDGSHEGIGFFYEADWVDGRVGACADGMANSVLFMDDFLARLERDQGVHWRIKMEKKIFKSIGFELMRWFGLFKQFKELIIQKLNAILLIFQLNCIYW